jgi:hypothetical protein
MPSASDKVFQLRELLAERFGENRVTRETTYFTGLPSLDDMGIPQGAVTEIVTPSSSGTGGMLLLYSLLHSLAQRQERVALVDGTRSFQPKALPQGDLQRLLWVRCRSAKEALQAVDLTARDGNFPLIIVLLTLHPLSELRRIPNSAWHRLQMLVEKSSSVLMVFTAFPQIGNARLRLSVGSDFPMRGLHRCRTDLITGLQLRVERRRIERRDDHAVRRSVCA